MSTTGERDPVASIGNALRSWRLARGLSQRALASRSGFASSNISRWEAGLTQPGIAELQAVLRVLSISGNEATYALTLLKAPRALRLLRGSGMPDLEQPPVGGDLLRAMRLRRGRRQEDVARALTVPQSTIARWERSESWPEAGKLHAICHLLEAHPEEMAALTVGRFSLASVLDLREPEEFHQEQWHLAYARRLDVPVTLKDLRFLALEARLHALLSSQSSRSTATEDQLERIQAMTYARHSQFLSETGRFTEVLRPARQAMAVRRRLDGGATMEGWIPAMIANAAREANLAAETPYTLDRIITRLHHSLTLIRDPDYRAWVLSEMARYAALAGRSEQARAMSADALRTTEEGDGASIVSERQLRRHDHALLLVKTGVAVDAAAFLPFLDGTRWPWFSFRNVRDMLASVAILTALHNESEAASVLGKVQSRLDSLDNDTESGKAPDASTLTALRTKADALASCLS